MALGTEFLEPMTASILSCRRRVAPWGMAGGSAGQCGRNWVERAGSGAVEELGGADSTEMGAGDVFVIQTPTAGGFGPAEGGAAAAPKL